MNDVEIIEKYRVLFYIVDKSFVAYLASLRVGYLCVSDYFKCSFSYGEKSFYRSFNSIFW